MTFTFSTSPFLAGENKVQHRTSSCGLLYHLEKEVVLNAFQEPPGLPVPCCVVPPTDVGVVEVPHEDQGFIKAATDFVRIRFQDFFLQHVPVSHLEALFYKLFFFP